MGTVPKNDGLLLILVKDRHVSRTDDMDIQTTTLKEQIPFSESSRKNGAEHPSKSTGVFDRPAEKTAYCRTKNSVP